MEIGHNAVREAVKRQGYGHARPAEALRRIRGYEGLKKVIVRTNSNPAAPRNYESVGFRLKARVENTSESVCTGDYLDYEMNIMEK